MKSYAQALFFVLLIVIAGCSQKTTPETQDVVGSDNTTIEETSMETESEITVEEITTVETVEEDLSLNDEEDDYGDII